MLNGAAAVLVSLRSQLRACCRSFYDALDAFRLYLASIHEYHGTAIENAALQYSLAVPDELMVT